MSMIPSAANRTATSRATRSRPRRHGDVLGDADRRALERSGWRTFLSYRENHERGWDGTLLSVTPVWVAEAERADRAVSARAGAVQTSAPTIDEAWARLRMLADDADRQAARRAARQRLHRQPRAA
ncbi:MAG: hypothetical protein KDB40_14450 [Acidimicrobiales bacterium]|nr:hypothetical protein [Acidimicrobiales bacterium]MCB9394053.1 hypothetical protein [Acidimicrobiaceae bacterium]